MNLEELREMSYICKKLGIYTFEHLQMFKLSEVRKDESLLRALRLYLFSLIER